MVLFSKFIIRIVTIMAKRVTDMPKRPCVETSYAASFPALLNAINRI